jgi:hypothetical protein
MINDAVRIVRQWLTDYGRDISITGVANLVANSGVQYKQLNKASIVGDKTTFTGVAGDKIDVTIDGTTYTVAVATPTTIALVVAAINTAVGSTVAARTSDGYLSLTSLTTGATSSVTIADGTGGNAGEAARLFSTADSRTDTAIVDFNDHLALRDEEDGTVITYMTPRDFFEKYPDYADQSDSTAEDFTVWNGRFYFGPTPSSTRIYYLEYFKTLTVLTSADTMVIEDTFDPLILALVRAEYMRFMDENNTTAISSAEKSVEFYKNNLIVNASRNIAQERGSHSRREDSEFLGPRIALR